jgi:hypothetical protein
VKSECRFKTSAYLVVLMFAVLTGCSKGGPEIASVSGKVLKNGKPVVRANIAFYPSSGRPSYGTSDETGAYSLDYTEKEKGAVVGSHTVKISVGGPPPPVDASSGGRATGGFTPPVETVMPQQILVKSGSNTIDLDLP